MRRCGLLVPSETLPPAAAHSATECFGARRGKAAADRVDEIGAMIALQLISRFLMQLRPCLFALSSCLVTVFRAYPRRARRGGTVCKLPCMLL